ncbi:efflux RND transporter periplasmic adaptor subunit [Gilvimarinus sp. 2_MG-2023]|uniref:efflux RND transporter periplasmic adaptor subunit n=1 Tax=Gilvimarinus sp. 2_MG-2023 TaxID=3062666 RepID=UPI0026E2CAC9|nr:efflux RND transporter periplasmic adaptor subunit [Gilvimarinus sp. 2_MG-2023]MDO6570803.1 efflux RND transporter periplasmic adaptor subunit [Gilvimarinus sp. 2_MG-2023]
MIALLVAVALGLVGGYYLASPVSNTLLAVGEAPPQSAEASFEPLYWVAPMDASYRRDRPGKSPMGMDLVPVYAEADTSHPADVTISSAVEQHLGLTTSVVTRRTLSPTIKAAGFVSFNEQVLTHFHLRATGWISNLSVNAVGDSVQAGQKLFDFYSPDIRNTQQEFLQALSSGNDSLIRASRAKLIAQGVPAQEINSVAKNREIKSEIGFYAQRSGVVAELNVANGAYVSLEQNTLSVGPLDTIWVIAEVFERQAGLLVEGLAVEIRSRAYPGRRWHGQIDYVYPVVNPANRTTRARIVVNNADASLRPNMLTEISISARQKARTLAVPSSSVIRTGQGERVVREVSPGVFRSTVVETGLRAESFTEITKGLAEGDKVVTNAHFLIDSESSIHLELNRLSQPESSTSPSVDHSNMDHGDGGHSQINHSQSEHSGMSHGAAVSNTEHPASHQGHGGAL